MCSTEVSVVRLVVRLMVGAPAEVVYLAQTDALLAFALQIAPSLGICFWVQQLRKGAALMHALFGTKSALDGIAAAEQWRILHQLVSDLIKVT
jgi:hypothetical protein